MTWPDLYPGVLIEPGQQLLLRTDPVHPQLPPQRGHQDPVPVAGGPVHQVPVTGGEALHCVLHPGSEEVLGILTPGNDDSDDGHDHVSTCPGSSAGGRCPGRGSAGRSRMCRGRPGRASSRGGACTPRTHISTWSMTVSHQHGIICSPELLQVDARTLAADRRLEHRIGVSALVPEGIIEPVI